MIPYRESKKKKSHSPFHSTSSPVQSPCAKECPLTPEAFDAKSLPSSQPHISIVHSPSSLSPSVAASSYEQPVLQNVNEHPSMPKPVKVNYNYTFTVFTDLIYNRTVEIYNHLYVYKLYCFRNAYRLLPSRNALLLYISSLYY